MAAVSSKNPHVQEARRLARDAKERAASGLFLVEGPKLVREAFASRVTVRAVFTTDVDEPLVRDLERGRARVFEVNAKTLEAITDVRTAQGIVAIAEVPHRDASALLAAKGDLLLVAGVQDPGNAGALVRIAAAAGFAGVIGDRATADFYAPKAVRGSAGSVLRTPAVRVDDLGEIAETLARRDVAVLAANPRGGVDPHTAKLPPRVALVMGSEGQGIPERLAKACTGAVTIPMSPGVESLNVAAAAAILCFALTRRAR